MHQRWSTSHRLLQVIAARAPAVEYIAPSPAVIPARAPGVEHISRAPAEFAARAPMVDSSHQLLQPSQHMRCGGVRRGCRLLVRETASFSMLRRVSSLWWGIELVRPIRGHVAVAVSSDCGGGGHELLRQTAWRLLRYSAVEWLGATLIYVSSSWLVA